MDKIKSLKTLLDPKKIAVIGASNSKEKVGGIVFRRLLGSRRRLFPVNPKETVIEGHKVNPDISSLPDEIDFLHYFAKDEKTICPDQNCKSYLPNQLHFLKRCKNFLPIPSIK